MAEDVPMVQMAKPDVFDPSAMFTQLLAEAQAEKWAKIIQLRDWVNKALEAARNEKVIGKPLEAAVTVYMPEAPDFGEDLADLCIVSKLELVAGEGEGYTEEGWPGVSIKVVRAAGNKCLRCWKYEPAVGENGLCPRCAKVLGL